MTDQVPPQAAMLKRGDGRPAPGPPGGRSARLTTAVKLECIEVSAGTRVRGG